MIIATPMIQLLDTAGAPVTTGAEGFVWIGEGASAWTSRTPIYSGQHAAWQFAVTFEERQEAFAHFSIRDPSSGVTNMVTYQNMQAPGVEATFLADSSPAGTGTDQENDFTATRTLTTQWGIGPVGGAISRELRFKATVGYIARSAYVICELPAVHVGGSVSVEVYNWTTTNWEVVDTLAPGETKEIVSETYTADYTSAGQDVYLRFVGSTLQNAPEQVNIGYAEIYGVQDLRQVVRESHGSYSRYNTLYVHDANTASGDPGAGEMRRNNAVPASVTELYMSKIQQESAGVRDLIEALLVGDEVIQTKRTDATSYAAFQVSGALTDNGAWVTIPVSHTASGGNFVAGDELLVTLGKPSMTTKTGYSLAGTQAFNNTGQTDNLPTLVNAMVANVITAATIAAAALNGKGDWNIGKTDYSLAGTQAFNNTGQTDNLPTTVKAINDNTRAAEALAESADTITFNIVCAAGSDENTIVYSSMDPPQVSVDKLRGQVLSFPSTTTTVALRNAKARVTGGNGTTTLTLDNSQGNALPVAPAVGDICVVG